MSLVMCNVGSAPRRNNSNEQNSFQSNPSSSGGMPRNSSSTSALNRSSGLHPSQSASALHQNFVANDNNNNAKAKQAAQTSIESDDANQVTIYR